MNAVVRWVNTAIATGGYLSYLPAALMRGRQHTGAGLIGTFWGVALLSWLPSDPFRQAAVWLGACAIAVVVGDFAEEALGKKDDPRIVIDETVGYWTAVLFLPRTAAVLVAAF